MNYGPERDPLLALSDKTQGVVSVYAHGRDYHDVVKARLKALGRWLASFALPSVLAIGHMRGPASKIGRSG